jgi:hypothetical protein
MSQSETSFSWLSVRRADAGQLRQPPPSEGGAWLVWMAILPLPAVGDGGAALPLTGPTRLGPGPAQAPPRVGQRVQLAASPRWQVHSDVTNVLAQRDETLDHQRFVDNSARQEGGLIAPC